MLLVDVVTILLDTGESGAQRGGLALGLGSLPPLAHLRGMTTTTTTSGMWGDREKQGRTESSAWGKRARTRSWGSRTRTHSWGSRDMILTKAGP